MSSQAQSRAWMERFFGDVDSLDPAGVVTHFTADGELTFGNMEPVCGRDAIEATLWPINDQYAELRHEIVDAWQDGDKIACQLRVTYVLKDGRSATLPAATVSQIEGNLMTKYQVYVDMAPLLGHN